MSAPTGREAVRLVVAAPARVAVVAGPVALTWFALAALPRDPGQFVHGVATTMAWVCVAVLAVAQQSVAPERLAAAIAWRRSGAGRITIWRVGALSGLLVGALPALVGFGVGAIVVFAGGDHLAFDRRVLGAIVPTAALVLTAGIASVPRGARRPSDRFRRMVRRSRVLRRAIGVAAALGACVAIARGVRTDVEAAIGGLAVIVLLVVAGVLVAVPLTRLGVRAAGALPGARTVVPIAERHRSPIALRVVVALALVVAASAAVLGASVEARPETLRDLHRELERLPVLPPNVAAIRLVPTSTEPESLAALGGVEIAPEVRGELAAAIDGVTAIELVHLDGRLVRDPNDPGAVVNLPPPAEAIGLPPHVVADDRLGSVFGREARVRGDGDPEDDGLAGGSLRWPTRVPGLEELARDVAAGATPPVARFDGVVFSEIPPELVAPADREGHVRTVVLAAPSPFTAVQLDAIAAVVERVEVPGGGTLTAIGPDGPLVPTPDGLVRSPYADEPRSLRDVPWAEISADRRWTLAAGAGAVAIVVLALSLAIDSIDRRRDIRRIEMLGATPVQVRGGTALYAGVLVASTAAFSALCIMAIVRLGTSAFSDAQPHIPVPFVVPWPVVACMLVGFPLVGAAAAAIVARARPAPIDRTLR